MTPNGLSLDITACPMLPRPTMPTVEPENFIEIKRLSDTDSMKPNHTLKILTVTVSLSINQKPDN